METFFNPHAEKQEHIINAALNVFGRNGYKKASIADIAEQAGIAKGMINYYFGSKKNLYLYLAELTGKLLIEEMDRKFDESVTDFFDNMKMMTNIKIAMIKEHPAIFSFLTSLYYENDGEVKGDIEKFLADSMKVRERLLFTGIDVSKFKDDINPKLLDKLLVWAAEGLTNNFGKDMNVDEIETVVKELYDCLDIMKKYFYKD